MITAATLGLVAPVSADASCAGPQLALDQGGASLAPRRVRQGDQERLLYDIDRARPLRVTASNLTFGCQDTFSATRTGCGAPHPDPVEPVVPMRDPDVVLTQAGRTWVLAHVGDVGPDLAAQLDVQLPAAVRSGPVKLGVLERSSGNGAELDLVVG